MMLLTPRISSYLHPRIQIRQNRQQTSHRLFSSSYWVDLPPPLQVSDDDIETEVDTRLPKTLQFTPNCPATTKHMLANKLVYQFRDDLHTLPGPYLTGNKSRWVDWVLFGRQVFRRWYWRTSRPLTAPFFASTSNSPFPQKIQIPSEAPSRQG